MKRSCKILAAAALIALSMSTTAFAGTWQQNDRGWWWQEDDHSYPVSQWKWLDGNHDGIAECYYFDEEGYLLTGTTTPDGYTVNDNGAWYDGLLIQEKALTPQADIYVKDVGRRLYLAAVQKTSELTSMAAKANLDMNMGMDGVNLGITMNMDMKFRDLNTDSMKYLAVADMNFLGQTTNETVFYSDGYYYMDMMGEKYKMKMPLDEMVSSAKSSTTSTMQTEYLTDFQLSDAGNGNQMISYTTDDKALKSYLGTAYSAVGLNISDYDLTVRDVSGTIVVSPEGYCLTQDMNMAMDMNVYGESLTTTMRIHIEYINPGQPVDFALPSAEGFEEM